MGVHLVAFCGEPATTGPSTSALKPLPEKRVHRLPSDLAGWARKRGAKEIVVALDERRGALPVDALLECRMDGLRVIDSAAFLERQTGRVALSGGYPSWLIFSNGFRRQSIGLALKRSFDIVASLFLLIFLAPLMAAVALAIKFDSDGPALYLQERVGQFGRTFLVIKFRSMVQNAEVQGKAVWASQNDPRVTAVGYWLRRTRLDELPQLINVLKGDMSLVGPRPRAATICRRTLEKHAAFQRTSSCSARYYWLGPG